MGAATAFAVTSVVAPAQPAEVAASRLAAAAFCSPESELFEFFDTPTVTVSRDGGRVIVRDFAPRTTLIYG